MHNMSDLALRSDLVQLAELEPGELVGRNKTCIAIDSKTNLRCTNPAHVKDGLCKKHWNGYKKIYSQTTGHEMGEEDARGTKEETATSSVECTKLYFALGLFIEAVQAFFFSPEYVCC